MISERSWGERCGRCPVNGAETRDTGPWATTYFEDIPTQLAAGERIGLPCSTYRRHLVSAVERVIELLWPYELSGTPITVSEPHP